MKLQYVREGYIKHRTGQEILPNASTKDVRRYVTKHNILIHDKVKERVPKDILMQIHGKNFNPDKIEGWGIRRYLDIRFLNRALKIPLIEEEYI